MSYMRTLLLVCLLIICSISSYAQLFTGDMVRERPKFGVQAGLSVPYQSVGGYYDSYGGTSAYAHSTNSYAGFTAGLQLELPLGHRWYIQPEANFSQMGGNDFFNSVVDDLGNVFTDVYTSVKNNYFQVPLLVKYKPWAQGWGFFCGPQYGYLISAKEKYEKDIPEDNVIEFRKRNGFSIVYGIEHYFPSANDGISLVFSLKVITGLTNNIDKSKYDYPLSSVRDNAIFLTMGVRF